mmetsp:Transcript_40512/g.128260  ORF Transcript_40512/g.128260 Transcript_40512/m.128260 type:complete len:102 (+) Transcript_40512:193-498(+)
MEKSKTRQTPDIQLVQELVCCRSPSSHLRADGRAGRSDIVEAHRRSILWRHSLHQTFGPMCDNREMCALPPQGCRVMQSTPATLRLRTQKVLQKPAVASPP